MQINYCDLCGLPLKGSNFFSLFIAKPDTNERVNPEDYNKIIDEVRQEVKDVCPTCKHIFDKMFDLRLRRLCELAEEINLIYEKPSKKNSKDKKNEKGK